MRRRRRRASPALAIVAVAYRTRHEATLVWRSAPVRLRRRRSRRTIEVVLDPALFDGLAKSVNRSLPSVSATEPRETSNRTHGDDLEHVCADDRLLRGLPLGCHPVRRQRST